MNHENFTKKNPKKNIFFKFSLKNPAFHLQNRTKIVLLWGIHTFSTIYESYYFGDRTK